jgi:hypothetical protein|tara:strand:- start:80 stop:451 length:372 start_codon:yes stop_codon:yes gene_type:complete
MEKDQIEKIRKLAENYGKQKTLKDKIKFVEDNPIDLDELEDVNFNTLEKIKGYFICIVRTKFGFFIYLLLFATLNFLLVKYLGALSIILIILNFYLFFKLIDYEDSRVVDYAERKLSNLFNKK